MAAPSLDEFLTAARADNPGVSDGALAAYWLRRYGPGGAAGAGVPKPEATAGGLIRSFGASAIDTVGSAMQGGGEVLAAGWNAVTGTQDARAVNPLKAITDPIRAGMSTGDKLAEQDTFRGDILDPASIELPKTGAGWAHAIASGFGSLSSMILPGAVAATGARGMIAAGAVTGALTTGGAAAEEVRQNIGRAMENKTADELAATIPAYREARAAGLDDGAARDKVQNDSAILATALAGAAGAAGGAFNAKVLEDVVAKRGLATLLGRAAKTRAGQIGIGAGVGVAAEGLQEGLEKVGQNIGENLGTGRPAFQDATRDTVGDVIIGGMIGGVTGGAAGAVTRREPQPDPRAETRQAIEDIARAPNADAAIDAFNRATTPRPTPAEPPIEFDRLGALGLLNAPATPAAPADTGDAIPYDYSQRSQMYPALPSPDMPTGRPVLINDSDPELTRAEQYGDREAAVNATQAGREAADRDRDLGITPGTRQAIRARVTLDEEGNILEAPEEHRRFLALTRRDARPHAAAAIDAHAINPGLVEAMLAAPSAGARDEQTVFEAIINGTTDTPAVRSILERHGVAASLAGGSGGAELNREGAQPGAAAAPGQQPQPGGGAGVGAAAGADAGGADRGARVAPGVSPEGGIVTPPGQIPVENLQNTTPERAPGPFTLRGRWPQEFKTGELALLAKNTRSMVERAVARAELDRRNPTRQLDKVSTEARRALWRAVVRAGGIHQDEAADMGIDRRSLPGYRMSGFVTAGGMRADILARFLAENDYLTPEQMADVDGGAEAARQVVADLLAREFVGRSDERDLFNEALSRHHDAGTIEAAGVDALPEVDRDDVADYDDSVIPAAAAEFDAALDAEPNMTVADAMRALGFTEAEISDAERSVPEKRGPVAPETGGDEPGGPEGGGGAGTVAAQRGEGPARREDGDREGATAVVEAPAEVDAAAHEAATSPQNSLPEPTEEQKKAGNYAKGHVSISGLDVSIENPAGSKRRPEWPTLQSHYGYFKRTEGNDGDHVDTFIRPGTPTDYDGPVFVVDQVDPKTGRFDEHKVMVGWPDEAAARAAYLENYTPDWKGLRAITRMDMDEFKAWLRDGDTTKPAAAPNPEQPSPPPVAESQAPSLSENGDRGVAPTREGGGPEAAAGRIEDVGREPASNLAPNSPPKTGRIEDVGEVLEGAKKHYAEAYRDAMRKVADADVAAEPLSKSWPAPDYEKLLEGGADPWVVAFVHAARDEVPAKPQRPRRVKQWADQVVTLRRFAADLLDGRIAKADLLSRLDSREFGRLGQEMRGRVDLYLAVGHGQSLKGVRLTRGEYSMWKGQDYNPPLVRWTVERQAAATAFSNWPRELAAGDTREAAVADFKARAAALADTPASKQVSFGIYGSGGKLFIGRKVGGTYARLKVFDDIKAAREYLANSRAELEKAWENWKTVPAERRPINEPRVGGDHRHDQNVSADDFREAFGFRGVQFGNYVEQGRRQQDINSAYDALMDLAGIIGVPPRALSLNGRLGLAFGARGSGNASAHFEAGNVVINLTKTKGAGSLAHEWWHALDNYFSRMDGRDTDFQSERGASNTAARPEMVAAFEAINAAVRNTSLRQRSKLVDDRRAKAYWTTTREMTARAFESFVVAKLEDQGQSNDYLANIVSEEYWNAAMALLGRDEKSYPYPTAGEIPVIREAYQRFFDTIESREDGDNVALFNRSAETGDPAEAGEVQAAIEGGDIHAAARWLAQNGPPVGRAIAAKVVRRLEAMKAAGVQFAMHIAHVGDSVPARLIGVRGLTVSDFKPGQAPSVTVWLNGADVTGKVGTGYKTALHELVHAATAVAIEMGNRKAAAGTGLAQDVSDLFDVTNAIIGHINGRYREFQRGGPVLSEFEEAIVNRTSNALLDPHEVVAWALTDADAQAYLESIPYKGRSMWSAFVEAIRKWLGLPAGANTALSEVLRVAENLLDGNINELAGVVTTSGALMQTQQAMDSYVAEERGDAIKPSFTREEFVEKVGVLSRGSSAVRAIWSFDDLPVSLQRDAEVAGMDPGRLRGVAAGNGRDIYIIGGNHPDLASVETTVFHELYGHMGIRKLFGREMYAKLADLYLRIGSDEFLRLAGKYGLKLETYGKVARQQAAESRLSERAGGVVEMRRAILLEELLATIAGKERDSLAQRAREILGMIRQWLRDHGFAQLARYNDADLANLLRQGRAAINAAVPGETAFLTGDDDAALARGRPPAYMRQDDYRFTPTTDSRGMPAFASTDLVLAHAREVDALGVPAGAKAMAFNIFDRRVKDARGKATFVGKVLVHMDAAGRFVSLRNIVIAEKHRQQGRYLGEGAILGMLRHNDGAPMEVYNIESAARGDENDALPFWRTIGTTILNVSSDPDVAIIGRIALPDYLKAAAKRRRMRGYGSDTAATSRGQPPAARGDAARDGQADAGGSGGGRGVRGRERRPADTGAVARRDATTSPARAGLSVSAIQSEVARLTAGWANAPAVTVLATPADAPFEAPGDANGALWRGRIYLFAANLRQADEAEFVLFHEALGHLGLRGAFGADLDAALRHVWLANKNVRAAAAKWTAAYARDAIAQRVQAGMSAAEARRAVEVLAIEEALADLAGRGERLTGLQRLAAVLQDVLRRLGFTRVADWLEGATDAEVGRMLAAARRFVETGDRAQAARIGELAGIYSLPSPDEMSPDDRTAGFDASASTRPTPTPTRREGGAGEDGSIAALFSRGTLLFDQSTAEPAPPQETRSRVDSLKDTVRGAALGAFTRRQLAEMYGRDAPEVAEYDRLAATMDAERANLSQEADRVLQDWRRLGRDTADKMADIMHEATLAQFDPDTGTRGDGFGLSTALTNALADRFAALPESAKAVYRRARDMYGRRLEALFEALAARIQRSGADPDSARRTVDQLREQYDRHLRNGPYFPLARFGDYLLIANRREATGADDDRVVMSFESAAERDRQAVLMKAKGFRVKTTVAKEYSRTRDGSAGPLAEAMSEAIEALEMDHLDLQGADGRSLGDLKGQLLDELNQALIRGLPELSYRKHFTHRKGTPGFSRDAMRAFADSQLHAANHIARMEYGDQLARQLDRLQERVTETGDGDVTALQQVANEMVKRHEVALNHVTHPVAAMLGQLGFFMSLGASVASGVVNLTQTPLVTYPWLAARYGWGKTSMALSKAARDYAASPWEWESGMNAAKNAKLAADETAMLRGLEDRGLINTTLAHDLAGASSTDNLNQFSKYGSAWQRVMRFAGWSFHVPEVANRQITALAAYRLARAGGKTAEAATEAAAQAITATHFDYSTGNRARYFEGNFRRVILMFKQYSQNIAYLYGRAAYQAFRGATAAEKREARRLLAGMLGVQFAAAGALGLPFVGSVAAVIAAAMNGFADDDEEFDWQVEFRKWMASTVGKDMGEALSHGLPRLVLGWDVAGRIGQSDLFVRGPNREQEGRDAYLAWMQALAGPVAGYALNGYLGVSDLAKGAGSLNGGLMMRGVEEMMPAAVRNALKAMRYEAEDGLRTRGGQKQIELDAFEKVGQAMGFTPTRVSEFYEGMTAVKNRERRIDTRRADLLDRYAEAVRERDAAGLERVRADIVEFNGRNPAVAIRGDTLLRSMQNRRRREGRAQDGIYLPRNREFLRQEGAFANL